MNVLQIILRGLVAFIPDMAGDEMCVLLVDARRPLIDGRVIVDDEVVEERGRLIPPHYPVIRAPLSSVGRGSRNPDWSFTDNDDIVTAVFLLEEEDLVMKPEESLGTGFSLSTGTRQADTQQPCCWNDFEPVCRELADGDRLRCPGADQPTYNYLAQKRDFSWVLNLDDGVAGAGRFKDDCFEVEPLEGVVVARLLIDEGEMYTYKLEGDDRWWDEDPRRVRLVKFENQDSDGTAAAREVALEVYYEAAKPPKVKFESTRLTDASALDPLIFEAPAGDLLKIWVENVPLRNVLQEQPKSEKILIGGAKDGVFFAAVENPRFVLRDSFLDPDFDIERDRFSIRHFEYFYEASEIDVDKPDRNVPTIVETAGDFLCPPVQGGS